MISSESTGSRLPVGASARMITGSLTSARAIAMRCCSPPDSSSGYAFILCWRPTHFSTWNVRRCCCDGAIPSTRGTKATLSSTVLLGSSLKSWNTKPSDRRYACTWRRVSFERSRCPTTRRPSVGISCRSSRRRSLDFPAPLGPGEKHKLPLAKGDERLGAGIGAGVVHLRASLFLNLLSGGGLPPAAPPPTLLLDRRGPLPPGWLAPLRGRARAAPFRSRARGALYAPSALSRRSRYAAKADRVAHSLRSFATAASRRGRPTRRRTLPLRP